MTTWDRFVDTFFNGKVMLKYLPDILWGVVVTIELAVLIVLSGLAAGLALACSGHRPSGSGCCRTRYFRSAPGSQATCRTASAPATLVRSGSRDGAEVTSCARILAGPRFSTCRGRRSGDHDAR